MSEEVIKRITKLVGDFDARVQATDDASWDNQSPCTEWAARDVVGHVASNLYRMAGGITRTPPTTAFDRAGDIKQQWGAARDAFITAVTTGDLSVEMPGPGGPMPAGALIGRLIVNDVLVHTWDLARAVGGDESLDADAVHRGFETVKPMDTFFRSTGMFGPKLTPPEGADEQTQFLAFLGRQV